MIEELLQFTEIKGCKIPTIAWTYMYSMFIPQRNISLDTFATDRKLKYMHALYIYTNHTGEGAKGCWFVHGIKQTQRAAKESTAIQDGNESY